ncbi:hypothetical protein ACIG47_05250 [Promicromonospora sp. NPDC052451]|uniref:hypothetical protein n=1 Tax=Promicromonospora sp. NPDC052451 TaxID=3364407 RepID=UPI0037C71E2F
MTPTPQPETAPAAGRRPAALPPVPRATWWERRGPVLAVSAWAVSVPLLWLVGALLRYGSDVPLLTGAEPFVGHWVVRTGPGILAAVVLLVAVVRYGPGLAARLPWRVLLLVSWAATAAWAVALAVITSWNELTAPVRGEHEYLPVVPSAAADPAAFLAGFVDHLPDYPIHVRGHPPGLVLLLAVLDRAGLGGPGWATALFVLAGAAAVPAVLVTLRALERGRAGGTTRGAAAEGTARAVVPALVLAPAALWVATSADAFFAGVLAWGVAFLALASRPGNGGTRWVYAVAAGLLLGACPLLSYGLLHMGLIALAPLLLTRRVAPTVGAGAVAAGVVVAAGLGGFWVWDGIAATHAVWAPVGNARPYLYFLLVDLAVLGAITGPAAVGGLTRLRRTGTVTRVVVGLALAAALSGALLGFERGEVERIWLPVAFWVVPAAAGLRAARGDPAGAATTAYGPVPAAWLWAQGGLTILLDTILESPW